jgi:hypothetical protein
MRRKNRKWVALAIGIYLLIMVSAYRWGATQHIPEGNIFVRMEHEGIRRQAEERARTVPEHAPTPPTPTAEVRLASAGPAYVAARYDATHIVFMVTSDAESRFPSSPLRRTSGTPTRIPAPSKTAAPLAGLDELYEPDSQSLHFFPAIVQKTQPGDRWLLSVSVDASIPVVIDRVVIAPVGCSLALGFLASVPSDQRAVFTAASHEYFLVRPKAVEAAGPPVASHIAELPGWKASPAAAKQIVQQLNARMNDEVAKIDARLLANAGSPGATAANVPVGDARPRLKEWLHADQGLARGEGMLDYDVRAFQLTPDGLPRLFVRARWKLADAPVFLMTAWFKANASTADAPLMLLSADASWSTALRNGEAPVSLGDRLDFVSILNEFDDDHDGWAELLVHSYDAHSYDARSAQGTPSRVASTAIAPYVYTDQGLVPLKAALHRELQSPESCLDP